MNQYGTRARHSVDSLCGADGVRLKNDSERIYIPENTIAAGCRHTVGLKPDGTVMAAGDNKYGQCDVGGWRGIVAVAAGNVNMAANTGNAHTIGLKSDGTMVAMGLDNQGKCDVSSWRSILHPLFINPHR